MNIEVLKNKMPKKYHYLNFLPYNCMICDTDLNIIFLNTQSLITLKSVESLLPVPVENILGASVDKFHKNPDQIRNIIQSISSENHHAYISLAKEILELNVLKLIIDGDHEGYIVNWGVVTKEIYLQGTYDAFSRSQAMIEFDPQGNILDANDNFIKTLGYQSIDEIQGKHHRIFCDIHYTSSQSYLDFWEKLRSGKFDLAQYPRIRKDGKNIWIQASYNPVLDKQGKVVKIVKLATDITLEKFNADALSVAMDNSQAVIEFNSQGFITHANKNFISTLGYDTLDEIKGKHHKIFCDEKYILTADYQTFWDKLRSGKFDAGQYPRKRKDGKIVWIQASYNPVLDINGQVIRIVKYATEITKQKEEWFGMLKTLDDTASQLSAAAEELTATATQLTQNAEKTNLQASSAASGAEELAIGMKSVNGSASELTLSIKEITQSTNTSARMSNESQVKAQHSNKLMESLGKSSSEIGSFVKIISSIAQQTNLLALNATIEAARAGEAGKGFAVVANEVKELAKQSAKAAEEISSKIHTIQNDTSNALSSINEITRSIDALSTSSSSISAAVEEQSATMGELSRIVSESNKAIQDITQTIRHVSDGAADSKIASVQTLEAAKGLAKLSDSLAQLVNKLDR